MSASRSATPRWSPSEDRKLGELLNAGNEAAEISIALNRSRQAIYSRLQRLYRKGAKLGLKAKIRRPTRQWTPEDDERLRKLAGEGRAALTIAERLKRSQDSVRNRAKVMGIKLVKAKDK
jgi:DNA-binding NarL/FixJ family response regulator